MSFKHSLVTLMFGLLIISFPVTNAANSLTVPTSVSAVHILEQMIMVRER